MYVDMPPTHCSKCDSTDSETFITRREKGIRCRKCGHEKIMDIFGREYSRNAETAFTASPRTDF